MPLNCWMSVKFRYRLPDVIARVNCCDCFQDLEEASKDHHPVSDIASATCILLTVCLTVVLILSAICRLLRHGTFQNDHCADGTGCTTAQKIHGLAGVEVCPPAKVPEDQFPRAPSAELVAPTCSDQHCSSIYVHRSISHTYDSRHSSWQLACAYWVLHCGIGSICHITASASV